MNEQARPAVQRWLDKAFNDLRLAKLALNDEPPMTDEACFHAQQCAEKSLKAFLAFKGKHPPRIHSLEQLTFRCAKLDREFTKLKNLVVGLSDYAVTARYPDDNYIATQDEARQAVANAERVWTFVNEKLGA